MVARPKLIAIVGPTASGKSSLAMRIAKEFDGEIIAADSQTVKRGMDIGTAKASKADQALIRHHLLDVIDPYERFTAGEFKRQAELAIADIQKRLKVPIIVGGTGMYIDALLYDFSFREVPDDKRRDELEQKSVEELQAIIQERGLPMPKNDQNKRHLVRVIETDGEIPKRGELKEGTMIIGIMPPKDELQQRIETRIDHMLAEGWIDEAERITAEYGQPPEDWDAIGYSMIVQAARGDAETLRAALISAHKRYAKSQLTWFKRKPDIRWFEQTDEAYEHVYQLLSQKN